MTNVACPRCGTFAPLSNFWGRALCDACVKRQPSYFRGPLTIQQLFEALWTIPLRVWLLSAVFHLLANVPSMLRTFYGVSGVRGYGTYQVLEMIAAAIVTHICVQSLRSEPGGVGASIRTVARRMGMLIRVEFLSGIWILAFLCLLVVPGVLKALSLALTIPIVLFERSDTFERVTDHSIHRMQGQRGTALGVYAIAVLPTLAVLTIGAFLVEDGDVSVRARVIETVCEGLSVILGAGTTLVTCLLYVSLTPADALPMQEAMPSDAQATKESGEVSG